MNISINNISHNYGAVSALKSVNLTIPDGSLFGVIGPDGSGKTTLFRILATLIVPSEGEISIGDYDVVEDMRALRNQIGYMPGRFSLYLDLTVEENLQFFASIFGTSLEENRSLIDAVYKQIEPFKKRKAGALSGGMKQKLALSCALIHRPELLILDEPTTGVDAVSRREFWDLLDLIQKEGITTVVSTPYMDEAMRCSEVALLFDGELLANDDPKRLTQTAEINLWAVESDEIFKILQDFRKHDNVNWAFSFGEQIHVAVDKSLEEREASKIFDQYNDQIISAKRIEPGIEDLFIDLTEQEVEV
ncbi:ABC transporter ATP-binding protein [Rhodohalobacter sp. 8-1]|uniref:ABC transporter ATP-binding protein n=1 Tax=Rhodohalobacter sp. 8-1 TaxID=3131972 RepID=UPI0030ED1F7D